MSTTICEVSRALTQEAHRTETDLHAHCGRGRFEGFSTSPYSIRKKGAGTFAPDTDIAFRMDTCRGTWFVPFAEFNHKAELRRMNLTHYSFLRTA